MRPQMGEQKITDDNIMVVIFAERLSTGGAVAL